MAVAPSGGPRLLYCFNRTARTVRPPFASFPVSRHSLRFRSRDAIAAELRAGTNPRLPELTPAGKLQAESCATLLQFGCCLPLWAIAA